MTFTQEQVERIVVEVIRRLGLLEDSATRVAVGERSSTTAELRLSDKVITTRTIENRLTGVSRLLVPPKAIVTPAVKDELKARKIELVRQA
jgi:hypothetical protein